MAGKMRFAVDLNLKALANAPNLAAGLLEAMSLNREHEPNLIHFTEV